MPPPPPPSASYNLKLDDFSDSEEEDNGYRSYNYNHRNDFAPKTAPAAHHHIPAVPRADGYAVKDSPVVSMAEIRQQYLSGKVSKEEFAAALRASHQANNNVVARKSGDVSNADSSRSEIVEAFNVTALSSDGSDEDGGDEGNDDTTGKMEIDELHTADGEVSSPVRKKKKKKKKKVSMLLETK